MISCRCLSNFLQAEPISLLWALRTQRVLSIEQNSGLKFNFGNSTCPMERYCDYVCTDPTQATARLVIVLVSRIQKSGTGDNNLVKWKGTFLSDRSKWTTHLQIQFGRSKPKRSVPLDVPTKISGILGRLGSAQWIIGNAFRVSLHLIGTVGDGFFNFSVIALSQILVSIF